MSAVRHINDSFAATDAIAYGGHGKLWADTEIIAGYGYHHSNSRFALSYLDEEIFEPQRNTVPISGVQKILEMAFGVKGPIIMDTMYKRHGIGAPDESTVPQFLVPENEDIEGFATSKDAILGVGHLCQLFGVGITGTAENNITVHKVGYRETDIEMTVNTADGTLDGMWIPFRYTEADLDPNERQKYFGKKVDSATGKTGYYLKRFEAWPEIKHIWRSADEAGKKKSEIIATNDTVWDFSRDDALKSLIEIHITVSEDDLKEWFNYKMDQPEAARFNTLALFDGRYTEKNKSGTDQFGDYCNVTLFSKLNIPTEHMVLSKDLEFIYRIYGS